MFAYITSMHIEIVVKPAILFIDMDNSWLTPTIGFMAEVMLHLGLKMFITVAGDLHQAHR